VFCCSNYENVLDDEGKRKFEDMEEAEGEAEFMEEKMKELNYEVRLYKNPTSKEMYALFKGL